MDENDKILYEKMTTAEVNGQPSNRSVRAKQEAIANPLNSIYSKAIGANIDATAPVAEQPKVEEVAPVEQPVAMTPDVSINSFSIDKPAPSPVIPETPVMESPVVEKPIIEPEISIDIPATPVPEEPVATQIDTPFVPPMAEVPNLVAEPEPMQNNGFGVPAPEVSEFVPPVLKEVEPVVNSNNTEVSKVFDEVLEKLATIDAKDKEITELKSKVVAYETAIESIKSTLNSKPIEESGEVFRKAA